MSSSVRHLPAAPPVFQTETDRIDLAVAAGALSFFLVCQESLACGEYLTFQTRNLRDVWRSGWRRIVQQVPQDPGTAFDRTAHNTVAAVVSGKQSVDEDIVAFEKLAESTTCLVAEEVGEGLMDFLTAGGSSAFFSASSSSC